MGQPSDRCPGVRRAGAGLAAALLLGTWSVMLIGISPAAACSCAGGSVEDFQEWAQVGFIGELVDRGPADESIDDEFGSNVPHRFVVERWIFGQSETAEVTVYSPSNGGSCGFELPIGARAAIFAQDQGDRFSGGLCGTMPADVALAEIEPAAASVGIARLAVVGNFAGSLIAYFDDAGTFLGYEGEVRSEHNWQPQAVPCEDGQHAAILEGLTVRVVSLTTAEDVIEPLTIGQDVGPRIARCDNPETLVLTEQTNAGGWQLRDPVTGTTTPMRGRAGDNPTATNHGFAMVEHLDPGERLLLVDGDQQRELGSLDRTSDGPYRGYASVDAAPDRESIGLLEVEYRGEDGATSVLRILDAATGEELATRSFPRESWGAHWVDGGHLAVTFGVDAVSHVEVVAADSLETVGRAPGWEPFRSTLSDGVLWGVSDGTLLRAPLGGEAAAVFTFPARLWAEVMVLPQPVKRTPRPRSDDASTTTTPDPVSTDPVSSDSAGTSSSSTTSITANSPLDIDDQIEDAASPDGPEGGGVDVTLVGGSAAVAGAALVGVLLFRQLRPSRRLESESESKWASESD